MISDRVQRVSMSGLELPQREVVVWNVHNYGETLAEARRARGGDHCDIERARADPQALQVLVAGDFNLELAASGRRNRAEMHWVAITRMAPETVADAPSRWNSAAGKTTE